jgi:hypothetical protein
VPTGQTSPRHLLPKDLPGALARLDDGEIDALLAAVTEEAKRRNRQSSNPMESLEDRRVLQPRTTVVNVPAHRRQMSKTLSCRQATLNSTPARARARLAMLTWHTSAVRG